MVLGTTVNCGATWRPVCLHSRERWEGQTDTSRSAYPYCPLYHARYRDRTLGGSGSYYRRCHDRSPWACVTAPQIWLDEGARRRVQSLPAPGTGDDSHSVSRVTMCAAHRERQWWKRSLSRRWSPSQQHAGSMLRSLPDVWLIGRIEEA